MTDEHVTEGSTNRDADVSLFAIGSNLLRWRRVIIGLGLAGGLLGVASGLLQERVYLAKALFLPQPAEGSGLGGFAAAASQFGIRVASTGGGWGPLLYVEILKSRALLEQVARDTVVVAEEGGRRIPLMDLLEIEAPSLDLRLAKAVRVLRRVIGGRDLKQLGAVELTVRTKWPSVSEALAKRMISGLNEFNVTVRKSQATAERQFVEGRANDAEVLLRRSEDRLQEFLQRNRTIGSPELAFERDRLQRDVTLRQIVFTSLVQNREDARIREVRDTPVITVIEDPRLPRLPEARKSVLKGMLGGLLGGVLGVMLAFAAQGLAGARREAGDDAEEFFRLLGEARGGLRGSGSR